MDSQLTFTVLIPTYNHAAYLGAALDSLLAQTNPDWEAVVVNDGSTDSTADIMAAYAARDARIRTFHKKNGGTSSALNEGLRQARGKWICWLSSDDLFDSRKLEIHQQFIIREANTSFFFTHFYYLDDVENKIIEPPLWRDPPEREWQILEMLRASFVHGISICVRREAMEAAGGFNEKLRYSQDYDMWMRLMTRYPASYIPEHTCIQRIHPDQGSNVFRDIHYFDVARAAIELVNHNPFEQLVPTVDLSHPAEAQKAIEQALDVASSLDSRNLYGLGPHPALLWRIIEWVLRNEKGNPDSSLRELVEHRVRTLLARKHLDPVVQLEWKSAHVALSMTEGEFNYVPLSVCDIAKKRYWQLLAIQKGNYSELLRYMTISGFDLDGTQALAKPARQESQVIIVCPNDVCLENSAQSDSDQSWLELTHLLTQEGKQVLMIGFSSNKLGMTRNVLYLGVQTESHLLSILRLLSPIDSLINFSQTDIFQNLSVRRPLIYQYASHFPPTNPILGSIQRDHTSVVIDSNMSSEQIIELLERPVTRKHYYLILENSLWKVMYFLKLKTKVFYVKDSPNLVQKVLGIPYRLLQKLSRLGVWWARL